MNKRALLVWVAVAFPLVALLGPALVSNRSFAFRDAAHFYYPLFQWCCREWSQGRVPLWNPQENCGLPVLADTTSSVFYPGKLVFLLPVDFALRYKLYLVLHVALAAVGSYTLARAWRASPWASALAAIAYAYGGGVVFQVSNAVFLVGAAWLPLAALAADSMLRQRSWRAAVWLGVVLALLVLGGDPEVAYHGLLVCGFYAVLLAFAMADGSRPETAGFKRPPRRLLGSLALIGLTGSVAFTLAAVQVLPSAEATGYSERAAFNRPRNIYEAARVALAPAGERHPHRETPGQSIIRGLFAPPEGGSHHDLAFDFSVGPWRLAEYIWPNIGGRMFPTNRRWMSLLPAEGRAWTPTLYLGLLPVVLACWSLRLRSGETRQRWLSWLVVIFTLASFGYYGLGWLAAEIYGSLLRQDASKLGVAPAVGGLYWLFVTLLPTYIYFRYPAKLLPLVSLGLSQLAAGGLDRAFAERWPRLERSLAALGAISGAGAFVVWCVGAEAWAKLARGDSSLGPFDWHGAYLDLLFALLQAACVALALRWLLVKAWTEPTTMPTCQWAAVLLTAFEVVVANHWLFPTAPADLWQNDSPVAAAIHAADRTGMKMPGAAPRVFRANLAGWRPPSFLQAMSVNRLAEAAQWEHDTLFPKFPLASNLSLVESYGSVKLMDYESLLLVAKQHGPLQSDNTLLPQPMALRLTGTEFLILPEKHQPEFAEPIEHDKTNWPEGAALWRMRRTLPRAWIVHHVESMLPLAHPLRIEWVDERTKAVLFPNHQARDFRRTAVVETDAPLAAWTHGGSDPAAGMQDTNERCEITHYDPQRVVVQAEPARPGLLVLGDAWFPGWTATTTTAGEPKAAPIYRTNRVLRGVWLDAGKQTIEFRFQPRSFYYGAAISGASWMILAAFAMVQFLRRRKQGTGAPSIAAVQME